MITTEENYINDRPVTINAEKLNQSSIVKICQRLFSMFSSEGVDSSADAYTYLVDMLEHMEPMSTPPDKHMWNERHM